MTAKLNACVAREVDRLLQELLNFSDTVVNAFGVQTVNFVSRLQRAEKNVACDGVAVFRIELIDIFLGKKQVAEIEHLQVCLKEFF